MGFFFVVVFGQASLRKSQGHSRSPSDRRKGSLAKGLMKIKCDISKLEAPFIPKLFGEFCEVILPPSHGCIYVLLKISLTVSAAPSHGLNKGLSLTERKLTEAVALTE